MHIDVLLMECVRAPIPLVLRSAGAFVVKQQGNYAWRICIINVARETRTANERWTYGDGTLVIIDVGGWISALVNKLTPQCMTPCLGYALSSCNTSQHLHAWHAYAG